MREQSSADTNLLIGLGIVIEVVGRLIKSADQESIGELILLIGVGFFVYGCVQYAWGKGYSKWAGLLGLLSLLGLIILIVLPDKHPKSVQQ
jgi:drug/metabolite transporter (DMT)-like permease